LTYLAVRGRARRDLEAAATRLDRVDSPQLYLARIVIDAVDIERSAAFWCGALGYEVTHKSPEFWVLSDPKRPAAFPLGIQPAEGEKRTISPLHIELFTDDKNRERARLEKLGASRVRNWSYGTDDPNWIVMRDPDGHEFCVCEMARESLRFP